MENLKKRLINHMEYLCLECGARQVGSLGEKKAADYIEGEFNKMGYKTVREEYPVIGWDCSEFSLWNVTKNKEAPLSGEDKAFFYNGIPTIWLRTQETFGLIHTKMDNLDNADYDKMVEYTNDYIDLFHQLTFTK